MQDARAAHTHTSALGHEELKEQTTTMVLNQEFLGEKCGGAVVVVMGVGGRGFGCIANARVANRWRIGGKSWKIVGSRQPINTMATMSAMTL